MAKRMSGSVALGTRIRGAAHNPRLDAEVVR
jgi:hypothetical protein